MKKIVLLCVAVLLCFEMIACGGNKQPATPSETLNSQPVLGEKAFRAEPKEQLELSNSINLNGKYYIWMFDLGMVYGTPVLASEAHLFRYNYEVEFSFEKVTSTSLQNSLSTAHQTVDTHSYTGGFAVNSAKEFSFEESASGSVSGGIEGVASAQATMGISAKQSFSFGESEDYHWTDSWSDTVSNSQSATESYMEQFSERTTTRIQFSEEQGYKKGYFYRVAYYDAVRTYGVLIYDVVNGSYSYAFSEFIIPNQRIFVIEESETGTFGYQIEKQLQFDLDQ